MKIDLNNLYGCHFNGNQRICVLIVCHAKFIQINSNERFGFAHFFLFHVQILNSMNAVVEAEKLLCHRHQTSLAVKSFVESI